MEKIESKKKSSKIRTYLNERRFCFGENVHLSIMQIISLFVINISLAAVIINLFVKGNGTFEWWSAYVSAVLIFLYLIFRIFTSSGIVLGRQVTLLITVFNIFLNLFKAFNIVKGDAVWELTFLIPLVNLLCMLFLVIAFMVRRKKFRTIIMPSLKIIIVSIIPVLRLYIRLGSDFYIPIFACIVLILAVALFLNSLIFNWLTIRREAEKSYDLLKKSASDFKKAGQKVASVNKKLESIGESVNKVKSFWSASSLAVKEFFAFKKKKENLAYEITGEVVQDTENSNQEELPPTITIKEEKNKNIITQAKGLIGKGIKMAAALLKKKPKKQKPLMIESHNEDRELALSDIVDKDKILENDIDKVVLTGKSKKQK